MKLLQALALMVLACVAVLFSCAPAQAASSGVSITATVNGTELSSSSVSRPVILHPTQPASISVQIVNNTSSQVSVRRVVLSARVLGLTFYSFDTSVNLSVPASGSESLNYSLDLTGLGGQATGLMNGSLALLDEQSHTLARVGTVTDVRGSLRSVYGLFGFALVLLTALALLDIALAIARHRMPLNRWRRGTRTMTPGIGIGLVLVFTLSAVRVWAPTTSRWLIFAAGFAAVFFVLGYLTPTPAIDDEPDEDDMEPNEDDAPLSALDEHATTVFLAPPPPGAHTP